MSAIHHRGGGAASSAQTTALKFKGMRKQASTLGRQAEEARAAQIAAEVARDKAELALRDMDRQFAAARARLGRAEALLRSHGIPPPDA